MVGLFLRSHASISIDSLFNCCGAGLQRLSMGGAGGSFGISLPHRSIWMVKSRFLRAVYIVRLRFIPGASSIFISLDRRSWIEWVRNPRPSISMAGTRRAELHEFYCSGFSSLPNPQN